MADKPSRWRLAVRCVEALREKHRRQTCFPCNQSLTADGNKPPTEQVEISLPQ
ncbi:MAG: hypothetical protein JNK57_13490 [Planctomycetaceae bacterium]|nr:hypothetical protein [Planctomycetaceae bacterium]